MRGRPSLFAALAAAACGVLPAAATCPSTPGAAIYVDPCSDAARDDANNGTDPARPLRTLQRAVVSAKALDEAVRCAGGVTVHLARGCTHAVAEGHAARAYVNLNQSEEVAATPQGLVIEGGLTCPGGRYPPLCFAAWSPHVPIPGVPAVISGAGVFSLSRSDAGTGYTTYAGTVESPTDLWDLWGAGLDGPRLNLSTSPFLRYDNITTSPDANATCFTDAHLVRLGITQQQLRHAFIRTYQTWTSSHNRVHSYDPWTGRLCLEGVFNAKFQGGSGDRYVVQNAQYPPWYAAGAYVFLPTDGVFAGGVSAAPLRARSFTLTVFAAPAGSPSLIVKVPQVATVVGLSQARNVHFGAGLRVSHSVSLLSETCLGWCGQSGSSLPTAAVEAAFSEAVSFTGVDVSHVGSYALWVRRGSHGVNVSRCTLRDLGAGGFRVGEPIGGHSADLSRVASAVTLADNTVAHGGLTVEAGTGFLVQMARYITIAHNTIHDLYYHAVSLGWTWNFAPTSNERIVVSRNWMYNIGRGRLSDLACVYNLGTSVGTLIDNNLCHNVDAYEYGGWGFYSDQATSDVTYTNNIAFHTHGAGYHHHYGVNVTFRNNVLAHPTKLTPGADSCGVFTGNLAAPEPSVYTFTQNIILLDDNTSVPFLDNTPDAFDNVTFGGNVYWSSALANPVAQLPFPPRRHPTNFSTWAAQPRINDRTSVVADPLFCPFDPTAGGRNYTCLLPGSPALCNGFRPIDMTDVGVRPAGGQLY